MRPLSSATLSVAVLALATTACTAVIQVSPHSRATTTVPEVQTTSTPPTSTVPVQTGGSGDTSPSAITTSADCPTNFSATLNKPYWSSPPKMTLDTSKTYTATVTTDIGAFTIALDAKQYPVAVNNFVFLAKQHFYDCIIFHRVVQTFVDQTGDPTGTGTGGPGYDFTAPAPPTASPQYPLGSVVMANGDSQPSSNPSTNGSQFFIVAGAEGETLAPYYALFGQVTSGLNVVQQINAGGSASSSETGTPVTLHRMVSVTISES